MATASLSLVSLLYFRSVTCQPEAASTVSTVTVATHGKIADLQLFRVAVLANFASSSSLFITEN